MKKCVSLFLAVILVAVNIFAVYGAEPSTPSGLPFSEVEKFIDNHVAGFVGDSVAGAAVIVTKNGEVIFSGTYGYANTADGLPVDSDTIFEWASVGKLLVWVSAMQLAEQGLLDLNADIREYLPGGFFRRLRYDTPITMYNLMHHNAGWGIRVTNGETSSPAGFTSLGEALRNAEPNQMHEPGAVSAYSNFGSALAGYVVERIAGQPFHEYVNENILAVLGMNDTAIHPYQADNPALAARHAATQGYMVQGRGLAAAPTSGNILLLYPAGGAVGTATDMAIFLAALTPREGEASPLFRYASTLDEMLAISYSFGDGVPGIAHGFFEEILGVRTLGHTGSLLHSASRLAFSPECGFGFIMVTNTDNLDFAPGLITGLFGEFSPDVYAGTLPDVRNLNNLTGWHGEAQRVENRGFMQLIGTIPMPSNRIRIMGENTLRFRGMDFTQISPNVFRAGGEPFTLHLITEGNAVSRVLLVSDTLGVVTAGAVLEFTPVSVFSVMFSYVSLLLFIASFGILVEFGIVKTFSKRKEYKKTGGKFSVLEKQIAALSILGLVAFVNYFAIIFRMAVFVAPYSALLPHFIFNIAYMVGTPIFCVFIFLGIKKAELPKKGKVFGVLACAASIVLALLMLLWEFYR